MELTLMSGGSPLACISLRENLGDPGDGARVDTRAAPAAARGPNGADGGLLPYG